MSMCYWMIEGVGLNADRIEPYLNKEKVVRLFLQQFNNVRDRDTARLEQMLLSGDYSGFSINDHPYDVLFDNLADILTYCDDTDSITYGEDGEGSSYFYYPPSMPWEMRETEPKTLREVHDRIIMAVQKITDLTPNEIDAMIDDNLSVVGYG